MNDLAEKRDCLLFSVRRSTRYHARRRRHFDRLNRFTIFSSVLLGSATFASLQGGIFPEWLAPYFAALVTFFAALDLAFSHAVRARDHHDFERRWIALEREIVRAGDYDDPTYAALCEKRLVIEADEEPPLRVLDVLCHNEQALADGRSDDLYKVTRMQRLLSQWTDWRADRAPFDRVTQ